MRKEKKVLLGWQLNDEMGISFASTSSTTWAKSIPLLFIFHPVFHVPVCLLVLHPSFEEWRKDVAPRCCFCFSIWALDLIMQRHNMAHKKWWPMLSTFISTFSSALCNISSVYLLQNSGSTGTKKFNVRVCMCAAEWNSSWDEKKWRKSCVDGWVNGGGAEEQNSENSSCTFTCLASSSFFPRFSSSTSPSFYFFLLAAHIIEVKVNVDFSFLH